MSQADYTYFKETFRLLNINQRQFLYRLKTYPFLQAEKKILKSFYSFKKGKNAASLDELNSFRSEDPFLEAMRVYLKGLNQNHLTKYKLALKNFLKAKNLFKHLKQDSFAASPLIMLSIVYSNRNELDLMLESINALKLIKDDCAYVTHSTIQVESIYLLKTNSLSQCKKILQKALDETSPEVDLYRASHLLTLFNVYLKEQEFEQCYTILDKYRNCSGISIKANYVFMKTLLEHLTDNTPLYIYKSRFEDHPELLGQAKLIQALSLGKISEASLYWKELREHNPHLYSEDLIYNCSGDLFSQLFEKYKSVFTHKINDFPKLDSFSSPVEKIHYILVLSNAPVSKFDLMELVWNEKYTELLGARLRNSIKECRKKFNVKIISKQDTYELIKKAA